MTAMMPLIEIQSVPIEIEMKVSHARLEYTRATADLESAMARRMKISSVCMRLSPYLMFFSRSIFSSVSRRMAWRRAVR